MVTSAAISGVLHISKKEYLFLISQYSGIKRPAWRIIHTGGRSVAFEFAASKNKLFIIFYLAKLLASFSIVLIISFALEVVANSFALSK